jgi:hypothetical protein
MTDSTGGPESLGAQAERAAGDAYGVLRSESRRLADDARSEFQRFASQRKEMAASYLRDISEALLTATEKLDEKGHGHTAQYARMAVERLQHAGDGLPNRDLGELLRQVEDFAHERPAVFIAGLFVAGFAAARFLRTSAERADYSQSPATTGYQAQI